MIKVTGKLVGAPDDGSGVYVAGTRNLAELQTRLRSNGMILRSEKEIYDLANVPPMSRRIVSVSSMDDDPLDENEKEALANEMQILKHMADISKSSSTEIPPIGHVSLTKRLTGMAKAPRVGRYAAAAIHEAQSESGTKRPIIVFSWHKGVQDVIYDTLVDYGVNPQHIAQVDSLTNDKIRSNIFENFQRVNEKGESPYHVMLSTIGVGGVGLNLQNSNHVIFSELEWQPKQLSQAEHRAYRIGQKNPVLVEYVVLPNSLDAFITKNLLKKTSSTDDMLGGDERAVLLEGGEDLISPEHQELVSSVLDWEQKNQRARERESPANKEILNWTPVTSVDQWEPLKAINEHMKGDNHQVSRVWVRSTMLFDEDGLHEPVKLLLFRDDGIEGNNKVRLFSYREDTQELQELSKRFSTIVDARNELMDTIPYMIEINDDDKRGLQNWAALGLPLDTPLWTNWQSEIKVEVRDENGEPLYDDKGNPVMENITALEAMRERAKEAKAGGLAEDDKLNRYLDAMNWKPQPELTLEQKEERERIRKEREENLKIYAPSYDSYSGRRKTSRGSGSRKKNDTDGMGRMFRMDRGVPKPNMPTIDMGGKRNGSGGLMKSWFKKHKPPKYAR